jgi:histone H3/H4
MADSLIVQSKVKEAVKAQGLRMDSSFPDALNAKIAQMVRQAADRAKSNGRGTIRPYDL